MVWHAAHGEGAGPRASSGGVGQLWQDDALCLPSRTNVDGVWGINFHVFQLRALWHCAYAGPSVFLCVASLA